ncbi:MAG: hypothetical protein IKL82_02460 [Clostridia bacterium]|nr:hypothetical protein [Clostridia bacterium]
MKVKKHYYLMISCPGDVTEEKEYLKECVEQINRIRDDDFVELTYWVTDTISDAATPAQESINKQLVNQSDGLMAIFNARLGTPVHEYPCGTAEEIDLMIQQSKHVSLLFNTNPRINLNRQDCLQQLTDLQHYKQTQQQKAYYKEFSDKESFKTLATQEIGLWLLGIQKEENTIKEDDVELTNKELIHTNNDNIDKTSNQDGFYDSVVIVTELCAEITKLTEIYNYDMQQYTFKTENFAQELEMLKKSSNQQRILLLFKNYAKETHAYRGKVHAFTEQFLIKWGNIHISLKNILSFNNEEKDKLLLRNAVAGLRNTFIKLKDNTEVVINIMANIPNAQKDVNMAIKLLASEFKEYVNALEIALSNCEDIENSL